MQIIFYLKEIPDVVWSGLLASGLTLLGVMLSNWSNTRRLLKQLSHDSSEKERDRINTLRKDVYLMTAEEASKVSGYLGRIPQIDPSKENIADGLSDFFGVVAKLQLVSQPETSRLAGEMVARYGEILVSLLKKASPVHDLNIEIRLADEFYERNKIEVTRILAEMTQMNESGEADFARFAALERSFDHFQKSANHFSDERSSADERRAVAMREYMAHLLKEMLSITPLQMQLRAAIRGELNLEEGVFEYEKTLQDSFERVDRTVKDLLDHIEG